MFGADERGAALRLNKSKIHLPNEAMVSREISNKFTTKLALYLLVRKCARVLCKFRVWVYIEKNIMIYIYNMSI